MVDLKALNNRRMALLGKKKRTAKEQTELEQVEAEINAGIEEEFPAPDLSGIERELAKLAELQVKIEKFLETNNGKKSSKG